MFPLQLHQMSVGFAFKLQSCFSVCVCTLSYVLYVKPSPVRLFGSSHQITCGVLSKTAASNEDVLSFNIRRLPFWSFLNHRLLSFNPSVSHHLLWFSSEKQSQMWMSNLYLTCSLFQGSPVTVLRLSWKLDTRTTRPIFWLKSPQRCSFALIFSLSLHNYANC